MKLTLKSIGKNLYSSNLKTFFVLLLIAGLIVSSAQGQSKRKTSVSKAGKTSSCVIRTTVFECPESFTKEPNVDKNTQLFKRNYNGSITYFFAAIPRGEFDDTNVRNVIAEKLTGKTSDGFRWNTVNLPFVMNLETKYEKKIVNRIGYSDRLINFVSRYFEFNGQTIVFGYGYKTENAELLKLFERAEPVGDSAIGCNAIATTLNSITKEKKGKLQYCNLSLTVSE